MDSLSIKQARKLVLVSQRVHRENDFGGGSTGLLNAIEHLAYIQIDTISVVERAHHHTLWNRVKNYSPVLLSEALARQDVFEYWSHAAAYLPMRDYRFSLPRKQAYLNGDRHWFEKNAKQMGYVKDRIRAEGELGAKDFDQKRNNRNHAWGGLKPAKMALEQLFMQGEIMVSRRHNFQKVFDLTERVLPDYVDQTMPTELEFCDHLIFRFLTANGIGTPNEIAYLRRGAKPMISARCLTLLHEKRLIQLTVAGKAYYALPDFETTLAKRLSQQAVKILSPFDNLLIQRQRMRDLFQFDYQIECYVTARKRMYGYFVLPILRGQAFIGRMDAKIDRKTKLMTVHNLFFESQEDSEYKEQLEEALMPFLHFNQGNELRIDRISISADRT